MTNDTQEKRFFNLAIWLLAVTALLILTACNPYDGLTTPTQEPTVTAIATEPGLTTNRVTPSPTPQTCTVQTNVPQGSLNIRAGAGVGFAVLEVLHEGQILTLTHQPARDGWIEVTADDVTGWINSTYCKIGE
jgi:uncharacterized protein YgiM (DUF1202 family)